MSKKKPLDEFIIEVFCAVGIWFTEKLLTFAAEHSSESSQIITVKFIVLLSVSKTVYVAYIGLSEVKLMDENDLFSQPPFSIILSFSQT